MFTLGEHGNLQPVDEHKAATFNRSASPTSVVWLTILVFNFNNIDPELIATQGTDSDTANRATGEPVDES